MGDLSLNIILQNCIKAIFWIPWNSVSRIAANFLKNKYIEVLTLASHTFANFEDTYN